MVFWSPLLVRLNIVLARTKQLEHHFRHMSLSWPKMSIYWCLNIFNLEMSFRNIPNENNLWSGLRAYIIWYIPFKKIELKSKSIQNFFLYSEYGIMKMNFENERHSDFGLILASNKQVLENKFLFTPSLGLNTWQNKAILCLMGIVTNVTELHVSTNLKFANEGHFGTFEKFSNLNFIEPSLKLAFQYFIICEKFQILFTGWFLRRFLVLISLQKCKSKIWRPSFFEFFKKNWIRCGWVMRTAVYHMVVIWQTTRY